MPYKDKDKQRECARKCSLKYYRKNREKRMIAHKNYEVRIKENVFTHYGGYICQCCGVTQKPFLTIDHINGGGTQQRKKLKGGGKFTYRWIHRNNYPVGFRVLCFNCNSGRAQNGGICPHEEEKNKGTT